MTYRGRSSPDACRAQELISGLKNGSKASAEDLEVLFSIKDQTLLDDLFAAAREVKERHFSAVFCYGFVYFGPTAATTARSASIAARTTIA